MTIDNGQTANADDVLASIGNTTAQLAYEQVKSDSTNWTNTDYLGADIFTAKEGGTTTVDTTATTSIYNEDDDNYNLSITDESGSDATADPDSFTNPTYAFDDDTGTYAQKYLSNGGSSINVYWKLGKTFVAKTVEIIKYKVYGNNIIR